MKEACKSNISFKMTLSSSLRCSIALFILEKEKEKGIFIRVSSSF